MLRNSNRPQRTYERQELYKPYGNRNYRKKKCHEIQDYLKKRWHDEQAGYEDEEVETGRNKTQVYGQYNPFIKAN